MTMSSSKNHFSLVEGNITQKRKGGALCHFSFFFYLEDRLHSLLWNIIFYLHKDLISKTIKKILLYLYWFKIKTNQLLIHYFIIFVIENPDYFFIQYKECDGGFSVLFHNILFFTMYVYFLIKVNEKYQWNLK